MDNPQPILPPDLEKWKSRSSRLPALHDLVRRQLDKATTTQAKYYNRKRREVYYQVDDLVRHRNHVLSSAEDRFAAKHAPKFVGPAEVIKIFIAGSILTRRVHTLPETEFREHWRVDFWYLNMKPSAHISVQWALSS